jgi:hypothetical protein
VRKYAQIGLSLPGVDPGKSVKPPVLVRVEIEALYCPDHQNTAGLPLFKCTSKPLTSRRILPNVLPI